MSMLKNGLQPDAVPDSTVLAVASDLWATSIMPEGILECWLVPDGGVVTTGHPVAKLIIEGQQHTLVAQADGRLQMTMRVNSVVEPGSVIGRITRAADRSGLFAQAGS